MSVAASKRMAIKMATIKTNDDSLIEESLPMKRPIATLTTSSGIGSTREPQNPQKAPRTGPGPRPDMTA